MVSTRSHPRSFPSPSASPTKRSSTPTDTGARSKRSTSPTDTTIAQTSKGTPSSSTSASSPSVWSHTPSNLTLLWLAISLPLVIWDSGYVFLRPHSMPGGKFHWPWKPYALYGTVDHIYGFKAYNARNGFTAAQGSLNVVETIGYFVYLWIVWSKGAQEDVQGRGAPGRDKVGGLGRAMRVKGYWAGVACLVGFAVTVMTWSKTVLYWLNEAYSGFDNIGHNDPWTLVLLWVIPNGPWIVIPIYLTYVFGMEILQGLESAAGDTKKFQ
ncbi:hypothetical protein CAC42_5541 [Sphaceloma murrayae]|uniref:Uncharacterized protein n=1 Tax=Sphaceloma murrayae TaxID=2082308 RepID=A0A2K1QYF7_9PEZI|nr:hypothetical protein CAC42_5541 [Sphaceloma murrayae]